MPRNENCLMGTIHGFAIFLWLECKSLFVCWGRMYSFKWENWFIDSDWSEFYFDKFILFWFSNVERLLKLNIYFDHEFYFNCLIFFTIILLNGNPRTSVLLQLCTSKQNTGVGFYLTRLKTKCKSVCVQLPWPRNVLTGLDIITRLWSDSGNKHDYSLWFPVIRGMMQPCRQGHCSL